MEAGNPQQREAEQPQGLRVDLLSETTIEAERKMDELARVVHDEPERAIAFYRQMAASEDVEDRRAVAACVEGHCR